MHQRSMQLWHERLSHVDKAGVLNMARNSVVHGLQITSRNNSDICEACVIGKLHRSPIRRASTTRASSLPELIHTDVVGSLPVISKGGARYFVTFIYDCSRWLTVYPIKSKSDCFSYFLKFRASVETQTGKKIKAIRSDGAGGYMSNDFKAFLASTNLRLYPEAERCR